MTLGGAVGFLDGLGDGVGTLDLKAARAQLGFWFPNNRHAGYIAISKFDNCVTRDVASSILTLFQGARDIFCNVHNRMWGYWAGTIVYWW